MKKTGARLLQYIHPKKVGFAFYVLAGMLLAAKTMVLSSCANIIPPGGGPRDSLPPVLVKSFPSDSSLHFNAKKITLTFNEYVLLDNNLSDNLIVSPAPALLPIIQSNLKVVTIVLKDSLKPNTTYSFNFGKAIKDVNEGNVAKNFTYLFSTGDKLDVGKLAGKVVLAETGAVDSTLLVMLHSNLNDTSIKKNAPDYFTRLDGKGNFVFRNIAPAQYNVFVLPNEYSKKYDDSTKMFAFLNNSVLIADSGSTPPAMLYAYQQFKPTDKKKVGNTPSTTKKKPKKETENQKLRYATTAKAGPQDLLTPFSFSFPGRVDSFDTAKIVLLDTNFHQIKGYSFETDTALTKFDLQYKWPENTFFKIIVQKDAFKDSAGNTLAATDTITFKTKRESEYGSIRLHFNNVKLAKNPVILLLQDNKIIKAVALTGNEWFQQLFSPGEFELRVLYDNNKNGVWNPGDYSKKLQPEVVDLIPRKLTIKANVDNEVDITL